MFFELLFRILFLACAGLFFALFLGPLAVGLDMGKWMDLFLPFAKSLGASEPSATLLKEMRNEKLNFEFVLVAVVYVPTVALTCFLSSVATKGGMSLANKLNMLLNFGLVAVHAKLYVVAATDARRNDLVEHVGMVVMVFGASVLYFLVSWLSGAGKRTDVREDATAPFVLRALSGLILVLKPLLLLVALTMHFISDSLNDVLDHMDHGGFTPRMYDANIGDSETFHLLVLEVTMTVFAVHTVLSLSALNSAYGSNARKLTLLIDWLATYGMVVGIALAHGQYYNAEGRAQEAAANITHGLTVAKFFLLPSTLVLFAESVWGSAAAGAAASAPKYKTN